MDVDEWEDRYRRRERDDRDRDRERERERQRDIRERERRASRSPPPPLATTKRRDDPRDAIPPSRSRTVGAVEGTKAFPPSVLPPPTGPSSSTTTTNGARATPPTGPSARPSLPPPVIPPSAPSFFGQPPPIGPSSSSAYPPPPTGPSSTFRSPAVPTAPSGAPTRPTSANTVAPVNERCWGAPVRSGGLLVSSAIGGAVAGGASPAAVLANGGGVSPYAGVLGARGRRPAASSGPTTPLSSMDLDTPPSQTPQHAQQQHPLAASHTSAALSERRASGSGTPPPRPIPTGPYALTTAAAAPPPPAPTPAPTGPVPTELYERLVQVGEGTYGKVYKARNVETGGLVALKRIRMESEKDGFPVTAVREIKLLQGLRHRNVVELVEMLVAKGALPLVFLSSSFLHSSQERN